MRKFSAKQKAAAGLAVGAIAVAGGGIAFAYWTSSGTGTGTATTTTASPSLVYSDNDITGLYPGQAAQPLTVTVKNNNASGGQSSYVTGLTAYLTVTQAQGAVGTCGVGDYLLDGQSNADSSHPVTLHWTAQELAAQASADTSGADSLQFNDLSTTNQDGCQGATVTLHYASN